MRKYKIGVIGLGYVGLPLAMEFGKLFEIKKTRILELKKKNDINKEIKKNLFRESKKLTFSFDKKSLKSCNFFVITVPTPTYRNKKPDIQSLISATKIVSKYLNAGDIVVYESTVYPGLTEEICIPLLEKFSGLKISNKNKSIKRNFFYCGYSPERINPGDKKNSIKSIVKIVSGSCPKARALIAGIYKKIIPRLYLAESIKVAEGAKIIENTQRDINIAYINELSEIFERLKIDFKQVLKAANTKWNFLDFKPGLVGGHCIGVDPYYLYHKLKLVGYDAKFILQGRKINDSMSYLFSKRLLNYLKSNNLKKKYKILILGVTFKENVADIRNSKTFEMIDYLSKKNFVRFYDPIVNYKNIDEKYKKFYVKNIKKNYYDSFVFAVTHDIFLKKNFQKKINSYSKIKTVIFDLKHKINKSIINKKIINS